MVTCWKIFLSKRLLSTAICLVTIPAKMMRYNGFKVSLVFLKSSLRIEFLNIQQPAAKGKHDIFLKKLIWTGATAACPWIW